MSEKEYKARCESLFTKNTVLLNQQKIDAEQIRALQKQNGELTDKVKELEKELEFEKSINGEFTAIKKLRELEAQIEKMKCCEMCKNYNWQGCVFSSEERLGCINNKRKLFELRR